MTLKPKQTRFVQEYMIDLNATQAAIRAGYSRRGAQQAGSRLLLNVVIQEAIAERQEAAAEKYEVTVESVAKKLELAYKAAAKFKQSGGMVQAQLGIAKLYGLITDKSQHTGKDGAALVPMVNVTIAGPARSEAAPETGNGTSEPGD